MYICTVTTAHNSIPGPARKKLHAFRTIFTGFGPAFEISTLEVQLKPSTLNRVFQDLNRLLFHDQVYVIVQVLCSLRAQGLRFGV